MGEAVLIRALEPTLGTEQMRARRRVPNLRELTNGPAKLCTALGIGRELDSADVCHAGSPLYIAENPARAEVLRKLGPVKTTPRIGITKAADLPLRFLLTGSQCVSRK